MLRGQLCEWWRVVKLLSSLVTEPFAWNLLLLLVCLCWPLGLFTERPGKAPAAPRASGLVSHTPCPLITELSCVLGKAALLGSFTHSPPYPATVPTPAGAAWEIQRPHAVFFVPRVVLFSHHVLFSTPWKECGVCVCVCLKQSQ